MSERIVTAVSRLSRLISDAESKAKESCEVRDLSSSQLNYLETIHELENPSITDLSKALGVKKPSVTVAIDKLITKGCVYKIHSDADKRSSHVHLTEVGLQINMRHNFAHQYICDRISQTLSQQEQELLIGFIAKICGKE